MKRNRALLVFAALIVGVFALKMPAEALTISPPAFDYVLNPGDTIRDVIKLSNETDYPITIYPEVYNFTHTEGDETKGTPSFYKKDEVKNGFELGPWISVSNAPITLPGGGRSSLDFSINVPKDGAPGSHFGSIVLRSSPDELGAGPVVSLVGGTGVLMLVRVEGMVDDTMGVTGFGSTKSVYTSLPVDFQTRLENRGNIHLRPTGEIRITNILGQRVSSLPVNNDSRSVLPNSARRFENSWTRGQTSAGASEFIKQWSNFAFGRYQATLVLNYGVNQKIVTAHCVFWVIPWMVLSIIVGGFVLLILALRHGLKVYARSVIRKYESLNGKK